MPGRISIKVRGIKTTRKKFKQLRDSVRQNSIDALDRIVKRIEADAKRIVPRDTANLQRTINSEVEVRPRSIAGLVGANTKYAKRLEDPKKGLKHQSRRSLRGKPTPFLVPALEKNFNRINSEIAKGVKTAVRRIRS